MSIMTSNFEVGGLAVIFLRNIIVIIVKSSYLTTFPKRRKIVKKIIGNVSFPLMYLEMIVIVFMCWLLSNMEVPM